MKTFISTCSPAPGMVIRYEIEANNKKDANWHARQAAFKDGYPRVTRFHSVEKTAEQQRIDLLKRLAEIGAAPIPAADAQKLLSEFAKEAITLCGGEA